MDLSTPLWQRMARQWMPPQLRAMLNSAAGQGFRFDGPFDSWEAASKSARGYGEEALLADLRAAAAAVWRGEAAWHQDGQTFSDMPPDMPLLAALSVAAIPRRDALRVVDVGGGLGTSYLQANTHLAGELAFDWRIVEQPSLAAIGRKEFETPSLRFYDDLTAAWHGGVDIAVLAGVLQYLPKPREMLSALVELRPQHIFIDRHAVGQGHSDLIAVQVNPRRLGRTSYPSWIFAPAMLSDCLHPTYSCVCSWQGGDADIAGRGFYARYTGSLWRRR